ncbi:class I SAM-dependent methyltransferase [Tenggerimyces flavus]|uniref:Class I SAM-dependent methyltransferase n=1 Tax=Tenggerimyces flavus TaxID=1708749 RepID=A0ABV7YN79_9ACTN|nr:class I SAM-dependent methyltransferase [Tenggerimyces flavus]MBM7784774.1 ubiquinone/menaquinone biosynthesis C-methylase UbiE [Tenggerimyces flavus]
MSVTAEERTERFRQLWSSGQSYQRIATTEVLVSELLVREVDVHHGERVLDVAAGTGNTALAAARRGASVVASDFAPVLLEVAQRRAAAEELAIETEVADAQQLPFADDSFDVVLSTFGAMHAADHERTAAELVRVCRPGGRLGLVAWSPDGLLPRFGRAMAPYVAAPPPGPNPLQWGDPAYCQQLFGDRVTSVRSTVRTHEFVAASARAQVELMRADLPPWRAIFGTLEPEQREAMTASLAAVFDDANEAKDGTLLARSPYLELIAEVR